MTHNPVDVGQENQFFRIQRRGNRRGHFIGIHIVRLIFAADSHRRKNRDQSFFKMRLDRLPIDRGDGPDKSEFFFRALFLDANNILLAF